MRSECDPNKARRRRKPWKVLAAVSLVPLFGLAGCDPQSGWNPTRHDDSGETRKLEVRDAAANGEPRRLSEPAEARARVQPVVTPPLAVETPEAPLNCDPVGSLAIVDYRCPRKVVRDPCDGLDEDNVLEAYNRKPWTIKGVRVLAREVLGLHSSVADFPRIVMGAAGPVCMGWLVVNREGQPDVWSQQFSIDAASGGEIALKPIMDFGL